MGPQRIKKQVEATNRSTSDYENRILDHRTREPRPRHCRFRSYLISCGTLSSHHRRSIRYRRRRARYLDTCRSPNQNTPSTKHSTFPGLQSKSPAITAAKLPRALSSFSRPPGRVPLYSTSIGPAVGDSTRRPHDVRRGMAVPVRGPHQCRQPLPPSLLYDHVQRSGMVRLF